MDNYALDVYFWTLKYTEGPKVKVADSKVIGKIKYWTQYPNAMDWEKNVSLELSEVTGAYVLELEGTTCEEANITKDGKPLEHEDAKPKDGQCDYCPERIEVEE